jgi:hypothetical protein
MLCGSFPYCLMQLAASPRTYFRQLESYHDIVIISTTVVIVWLDLFQV